MHTRRSLLMSCIASVGSPVLLATREALGQFEGDADAILLSGFNRLNDKGAGAIYVRTSHPGSMSVKDAVGRWWNLSANQGVWAGWFGLLGDDADETECLQAAIDYVAARPGGGTVRIVAGSYVIGSERGRLPLPSAGAIEHMQAYCLVLPDNVRIEAEEGTVFKGPYKFGSATSDDVICITNPKKETCQRMSVQNIVFDSYFIAIGFVSPQTVALSSFIGNEFLNCGIGVYSRGLERCKFETTIAQGTGAVIVVGGRWSTDKNIYSEGGGFADKTSFGTIHNIYGREFGEAENAIDSYFDKHFFMTEKTSVKTTQNLGNGVIGGRFPYKGLCGRCVYLMARHARPNNANTFGLISHAFAPRAAVWIDAAVACVGQAVYLESCGFRDNIRRADAIGTVVTDPYLGKDVRVPAFVHGLRCPIDAQFITGRALSPGNEFADNAFGCDLLLRQETKMFAEALSLPAIVLSDGDRKLSAQVRIIEIRSDEFVVDLNTDIQAGVQSVIVALLLMSNESDSIRWSIDIVSRADGRQVKVKPLAGNRAGQFRISDRSGLELFVNNAIGLHGVLIVISVNK